MDKRMPEKSGIRDRFLADIYLLLFKEEIKRRAGYGDRQLASLLATRAREHVNVLFGHEDRP